MADRELDRPDGTSDDSVWGHRWGFRDTAFVAGDLRSTRVTGNRYALSGTEMPDFLPFVQRMLGMPLDFGDLRREVADKPVPAPVENPAFLRALAEALPAGRFTRDPAQRLLHSHGQTTADEVNRVLYGHLERVADLVACPESEDEVATLVRLAGEHDVCLVPYGGGTSVSSALKLPADEKRLIAVVDLRRMDRIEWIDRENLRACVEAGITGRRLEQELERHGLTCGHEPDSLELSTLGGWIATNAAGMKRNRYGNIEDLVEAVTMVTARGVVAQGPPMPRVSMGVQPRLLAFGSEGNLGFITRAVIRVHPLPEVRRYGSIVFPNFQAGTAFLHDLSRTGALPASLRLVDNLQFQFGRALRPKAGPVHALLGALQKLALTRVFGFDPEALAAATVLMEGTRAEVRHQSRTVFSLARRHGGLSGGAANGRRGYMLTYAIAYIRDFLSQFWVMGETYETTVPWSRVDAVIEAVRRKADELHQSHGLPGRPFVSPRITQIYHTGVCVYFTHGFSAQGHSDPEALLASVDHALRETIMEAGGSVSHHHGVGKLRRPFLLRTLSPAAIEVLKGVKKACDPGNVFGIRNSVLTD